MKMFGLFLATVMVFFLAAGIAQAEIFKVVIMASQDPKVEGPKFEALTKYISANSDLFDKIQLRIARNYPDAVDIFRRGEADGMVAGSFVAAILIKKGVAVPIARPLGTNGVSTYKALVVSQAGTKTFAGIGDFKGKKVAYSALASSGEIFARSLLPAGEKPEDVFSPVIVPSHQAALNAVQNKAADYAVVKNTVWSAEKYPGLRVVGGDDNENPDNTLILSNTANKKYGKQLKEILLRLQQDNSGLALEVKKVFGARSFISTTETDFSHTLQLVEKARINPATFEFTF